MIRQQELEVGQENGMAAIYIDVPKGVLGGLTPSLRLKIWADPPSWKIFEQVTP